MRVTVVVYRLPEGTTLGPDALRSLEGADVTWGDDGPRVGSTADARLGGDEPGTDDRDVLVDVVFGSVPPEFLDAIRSARIGTELDLLIA